MIPPRNKVKIGLAVAGLFFLTACTPAPAAETAPAPVTVVEVEPEITDEPETLELDDEVVDEEELAAEEPKHFSDFAQIVPQLAVTTWDSLSAFDDWTEEQPEWWQDRAITWVNHDVIDQETGRQQEIELQINPDGTIIRWALFVGLDFDAERDENGRLPAIWEYIVEDYTTTVFNADGTVTAPDVTSWSLSEDNFELTITFGDGSTAVYQNLNFFN